jgi:5-methylcytosine-specific restriction protein A
MPTCGRLQPCPLHPVVAWRSVVPPSVTRITGRRLQALRYALFRRQPLCVQCLKDGRSTVATIRDHIQPIAEGGADDDANTQALCQRCSDAKTNEEAARGRRRVRT